MKLRARNKKKIVIFAGMLFGASMYVVNMLMMIFCAFHNWRFSINMNMYNEGLVELIIFPFVGVVIFLGLWFYYRELCEDE